MPTPLHHQAAEQEGSFPWSGSRIQARTGPSTTYSHPVLIALCQCWVPILLTQQIAKRKRKQKQKADQPKPHVLSINSNQSSWFQCSDHTRLAFQQLHPKLTSLFGASGFEHVLSDPPLLAAAWPPASHVAPDDYAAHLLPSDAQLEINTDKNPQISLQNSMVWTRQSKWEGDSRPERKTVLGTETLCSISQGGEVLNSCYASSLRLPHFSTEGAVYVCLLPKQDLHVLIACRFIGNAF